jgi:hypothetical protein
MANRGGTSFYKHALTALPGHKSTPSTNKGTNRVKFDDIDATIQHDIDVTIRLELGDFMVHALEPNFWFWSLVARPFADILTPDVICTLSYG